MALKNAFIYVDGFGEHYGYNDIGLVSDKYNDEGTAYEYSYENNNVSLVSRTVSGIEETVAENTYDANGNQTETVNNDGTSITTTYAGGLPISKTVSGSGDETYTEQFSYYPGGNYLATYTDYSGGVTQFFYDNNTEVTAPILKGLLTKIIDANGNVKTFAYDANTDEMSSASGTVASARTQLPYCRIRVAMSARWFAEARHILTAMMAIIMSLGLRSVQTRSLSFHIMIVDC